MSVPLTNEFFGQVSACKFILHIGASSRKGCGTKNLGKNKGFFLHFVLEKSKPHRWIERSEIQLMFGGQPGERGWAPTHERVVAMGIFAFVHKFGCEPMATP